MNSLYKNNLIALSMLVALSSAPISTMAMDATETIDVNGGTSEELAVSLQKEVVNPAVENVVEQVKQIAHDVANKADQIAEKITTPSITITETTTPVSTGTFNSAPSTESSVTLAAVKPGFRTFAKNAYKACTVKNAVSLPGKFVRGSKAIVYKGLDASRQCVVDAVTNPRDNKGKVAVVAVATAAAATGIYFGGRKAIAMYNDRQAELNRQENRVFELLNIGCFEDARLVILNTNFSTAKKNELLNYLVKEELSIGKKQVISKPRNFAPAPVVQQAKQVVINTADNVVKAIQPAAKQAVKTVNKAKTQVKNAITSDVTKFFDGFEDAVKAIGTDNTKRTALRKAFNALTDTGFTTAFRSAVNTCITTGKNAKSIITQFKSL